MPTWLWVVVVVVLVIIVLTVALLASPPGRRYLRMRKM